MKQCTACKETKPYREFYTTVRNGWQSKCKTCTSKWNKQYHKQRYAVKGYDAKAKQNNAWGRGIVCADINAWYDKQYDAQQGKCAMPDCTYTAPKDASNHNRLHIDHDHVTGLPRGLLCGSCNRLVGFYEKALQRPVTDYLRTFSAN